MSSDKTLPCPFCGEMPDGYKDSDGTLMVKCRTKFCAVGFREILRCDWQKRKETENGNLQ